MALEGSHRPPCDHVDVDLEDGLHEPPLGSGTQPCPLRLWLTWEDQESGGPGPGPHLRADRGTLPFLLRGLRGVGGPQVGGLGSPQRGQARKHGRRAQGGGGGPGLVGMGFRCRLTPGPMSVRPASVSPASCRKPRPRQHWCWSAWRPGRSDGAWGDCVDSAALGAPPPSWQPPDGVPVGPRVGGGGVRGSF